MADRGTKIFVGGLSWQTSDVAFRDYFAAFGEVESAVVMRTGEGKSRGFGFVIFKEPHTVQQVLKTRDLELDGRKIDCKPAVAKEDLDARRFVPEAAPFIRTNKIFVGGLASETTREEFEQYFQKYGNVTDAVIMTDKSTGRSRGFGFVTFDSEFSAEKVANQAVHFLGEKQVDCKRAVPKDMAPAPRGRGAPFDGPRPYERPYEYPRTPGYPPQPPQPQDRGYDRFPKPGVYKPRGPEPSRPPPSPYFEQGPYDDGSVNYGNPYINQMPPQAPPPPPPGYGEYYNGYMGGGYPPAPEAPYPPYGGMRSGPPPNKGQRAYHPYGSRR